MKKYLLFLIFFNYSFYNNAQNSTKILASYDVILNTESPRTLKGYIEGDSKEFYYVTHFKQSNNSILNDMGNEMEIQLGSKPQIIYTSFIDSTLYSTKKLKGTNYIIREDLPVFKWKIMNERKKINDFNCTKATTTFRGRSYIAWFTEDIPVQIGPYKFNGLPGFIVEIFDESERFRWLLTEIKTSNTEFIEDSFNELEKKSTQIELKEFIEKSESNVKNSIETKLPRGVNVAVEYKSIRNGIELVYEWEEN